MTKAKIEQARKRREKAEVHEAEAERTAFSGRIHERQAAHRLRQAYRIPSVTDSWWTNENTVQPASQKVGRLNKIRALSRCVGHMVSAFGVDEAEGRSQSC